MNIRWDNIRKWILERVKHPAKIIDVHNHIGNDATGKSQIVTELLERMKRNGIGKCVIFPFDDVDKGECFFNSNTRISNISKKNKNLIGFGRIDPKHEKVMEEIERIALKLKLKGIKLHPKYQKFKIDEVDDVLEKILEFKLPTIIHSAAKNVDYLEQIRRIIPSFPELRIILAHAGIGRSFSTSMIASENKSVYLEISLNPKHLMKRIIENTEIDKILFGSDTPYGSFERTLENLNCCKEKMDLGNEEMEKILWRNASNLLEL